MLTLKQLKEDLPVINRLHIRRPGIGNLIYKPPTMDEMQETIHFVRKNTVPAREGRKCVDGRYPPDTARGMLARAGGDCGYVMALMGINRKKKLQLTPEQCFNAVYKVISQKLQGAFCVHTDHHADPEYDSANDSFHQTLIGCGHLSKAAGGWSFRHPYDVQKNDVKKIIAYAKNLAEIGDHVEMVNLDGEHTEQGVLIIDDTTHTVNPMDPKEHTMYFIYDRKRDEAFMKKLVDAMAIPEITFEDMKKEADIQLQVTLHNIAKGLPIYTVSYKHQEPQVKYLATIN